jgi:hypothetical protein
LAIKNEDADVTVEDDGIPLVVDDADIDATVNRQVHTTCVQESHATMGTFTPHLSILP